MSDCVTLSPVLCRVPCTGFGPRTSPVFALYCWPVTADPSLHCIPSHLRRWHSVLQLVSSGRSWPAFWPDVCLCRGSYILGDIQPTSAQPIKVAGSVMLIDKVKLYWNEWQYHLLAFNQPPLESERTICLSSRVICKNLLNRPHRTVYFLRAIQYEDDMVIHAIYVHLAYVIIFVIIIIGNTSNSILHY